MSAYGKKKGEKMLKKNVVAEEKELCVHESPITGRTLENLS